MRRIITIAALLGVAFMAGWFTVNRDGDRTTIEINRQEIRSDTKRAFQRGREYLNRLDNQQPNDSYQDISHQQDYHDDYYPPANSPSQANESWSDRY